MAVFSINDLEESVRKFSSYGPVDKDQHFYVPRSDLVNAAASQLTGETQGRGGRYVTVWAPRQCGKTWIMREVVEKISQKGEFDVAIISMQSAKTETLDEGVLDLFVTKLEEWFDRSLPKITVWKHLRRLFAEPNFENPVILVIDEFDAVQEDFINRFANEFRDIYITRQAESFSVDSRQKCSLHGLALIGVRSVLGIENDKGSPFNVQRSMHIPNLTLEEVRSMFGWYEKESGQTVEPDVVERIFNETWGQPGLVSWFGELLTEVYNPRPDQPITMKSFDYAFKRAVQALPNNNILNIISKAKQAPYKDTVLELFRTDRKIEFAFDEPHQNFLYMNGVIDFEEDEDSLYVRFSCPFVQKRLFNYFSREIFQTLDHLYDPMTNIEAIVAADDIRIPELMTLYGTYLSRNREWLLKDAPRRKTDLRIHEAVFHFNLYMYLKSFFQDKGGDVFPEFPTGNGKVDILIRRAGKLYALELKSFKDRYAYKLAIHRSAEYAIQLGIQNIFLIFFIESIDEENRRALETPHRDEETGVEVQPIFVETGNVSGWNAGG